jgi:8-oxo-dGTP pyrophosphatase MutT (NUDIX family)
MNNLSFSNSNTNLSFSNSNTKKFAAGIVPYIILENKKYFLLGLERSNNLWSGFVGGSEPNETIEQTALREFNEETARIFEEYIPFIESELIKTKPTMDITSTGKNVYIYFIEFPNESQEKIKDFMDHCLEDPCYNEKSILRFFTVDEIKKSKVFFPLKKMLTSSCSFI